MASAGAAWTGAGAACAGALCVAGAGDVAVAVAVAGAGAAGCAASRGPHAASSRHAHSHAIRGVGMRAARRSMRGFSCCARHPRTRGQTPIIGGRGRARYRCATARCAAHSATPRTLREFRRARRERACARSGWGG
ncbi:hypothetical protein FE772_13240 [Lysobacter enzymogenes]|nr:hypothetical protein FE772_13240 [Lysobacter enzymogenes]